MMTAKKERVLVVDDEPQVLVALEDLLDDSYVVLKSESPERALRLVEAEPDIAVILSDQRMPHMTGDEFFARLDGRSEATRIMVTGFADLSAVVRAVNDGKIFAYVTKPWNPEDLKLVVHKGADYFRLAKELAYERQLLHDLMDNVPDGIYFKDLDLHFVRANRPVLALLDGGDSAKLVGKRLVDVAPHESDALATEAEERRILLHGRPALDVVRGFPRHGRQLWISESKAPIRSPKGEIIGLVGISRDVTERIEIEEALRSSEERLQLTFRGSAAGLFDWNIITGEMLFSPSFGALLGHPEPGWTESPAVLAARLHPDDLPNVRQALRRHFDDHEPFNNLELRGLRDGEYHWFLASGQAVWNDAGDATRLAGSITDITLRKVQEARINRLTRIHAVLGGINAAIVRTVDRDSLIQESCRIAVDVGEFALAVVASVDPVELIAWEKARAPFIEVVKSAIAGGGVLPGGLLERIRDTRRPLVFNDVAADATIPLGPDLIGHGYRALAVFPLLTSGRVDCALALFSEHSGVFDSTEVKLLTELAENISFALEHAAQAERLNFLAYYDALTRLPNRDLLRDRVSQQIAACRGNGFKLAVLLIDIGRFRHVNETLGRRGGDDLLVQVAGRLKAAFAPQDTVARFDSNTFAVVIGSVDEESDVALFIENRLLPELRESFMVEGTELRISARCGIALSPSDGQDPDALLGNAEAAVKNAKSIGQAYMFYAPSMNARVAEKLTLETKLRRAVDKDEFLLHYQPKVDFKTGSVVGLEALIRWRDPMNGLIPPGQFIPVLEDTGLILEVGRWVLRRAAAQYTEWVNRGLAPPRIAVNVSAIQLAQKDFVNSIDTMLKNHPLAAEGVDLEITESVFVEDLTGNAEKLRLARARGLEVAIDDFGTGYSSLGYLSRLPIDALKIDRSFVIRMLEDPRDTSIVTTIISLAHSLDLKVVAEGVETTQQAHLLRLLKCDQMQGYLASKPLPPEELEKVLGTTLLELNTKDSS